MERNSYSIDEICARHNCSRPFVYKQIRLGKLKSIHVGRLRRITAQHEREWLEAHVDARECA